jgi:hypothetical protein
MDDYGCIGRLHQPKEASAKLPKGYCRAIEFARDKSHLYDLQFWTISST